MALTARAEILEPKRVMSVFKDKDFKRDIVSDISELEDYEKMEEKKFPVGYNLKKKFLFIIFFIEH